MPEPAEGEAVTPCSGFSNGEKANSAILNRGTVGRIFAGKPLCGQVTHSSRPLLAPTVDNKYSVAFQKKVLNNIIG